jgi:hypothetical protein
MILYVDSGILLTLGLRCTSRPSGVSFEALISEEGEPVLAACPREDLRALRLVSSDVPEGKGATAELFLGTVENGGGSCREGDEKSEVLPPSAATMLPLAELKLMSTPYSGGDEDRFIASLEL